VGLVCKLALTLYPLPFRVEGFVLLDNYVISEYTFIMEKWKSIGDKLRALRKSGKFTLKDVSKKTKLSLSFISEIELGVVDPSLKTSIKLAKFHKTTVYGLFSGIEGMS